MGTSFLSHSAKVVMSIACSFVVMMLLTICRGFHMLSQQPELYLVWYSLLILTFTVKHGYSAPLRVISWIKFSVASATWFEFSVFKCVFNILEVKQINWALRQLRARDTYFVNLKQLYGGSRYLDDQFSQNSGACRHAQYSILAIQGCICQGHICLAIL